MSSFSVSGAPWSQLCRADALEFRAACNSVAKAEDRPIKRRVAERISQLPEAESLFGTAWLRASQADATPDSRFFFGCLISDPAWSTLVLEALERERSWFGAGGTGPMSKLRERVRAFFDKLLNRNSHPITYLVAMTLTSASVVSATLAVTIRVLPEIQGGGVSIPVSLVPDSRGGGQPIAVPVQLTGLPTQIPINLVNPGANPIEVHLTDPVDVRAGKVGGLDSLTREIASLNGSLRRSVSQDAVLGARVEEIRQEVGRFADVYREEAASMRAVHEQLAASLARPLNTIAGSVNSEHVFSQQRQVTLRANSSISMVLPRFDAAGLVDSFVVLNVCTGSIRHGGKQGGYAQIGASPPTLVPELHGSGVKAGGSGAIGKSPCHVLATARPGSAPQALGIPWSMTVNSIDRHWNGGESVSLTLTPDLAGLGPATAAQTDTQKE